MSALLPETPYGGHWDLRNVGNENAEWVICTFNYAELMFANVHSRTDTWYYEPCNIVQLMDRFYTYVLSDILVWNMSWHHCHDLGLCETSYKDNWDLHKQAMRASPFRSAPAMSQCHSHHVLCIANSACTHEVTHQNGFTLYVFSQTIFMLH